MFNHQAKRGFTLIELLVVVLIIGILAAVALPQYQKSVLKSRYMQLEIIGRAIYNAEQAYFLANGEYTDNFEKLTLSFPGTVENEGENINSVYRLSFGSCLLLKRFNELECTVSKQPIYFFMYWHANGKARCRCFNSLTCSVCKSICKITTPLEPPSGGHVECVY